MFGFLQRKAWPIAVDLGADSIKMLQMKRVGAGVRVVACARWRYPLEARQDPARRRPLAVQAVKEILRVEPFRGRDVVSALPCRDLIIKNIRLASLAPADLDRAVRGEIQDRLGDGLDSSQISYLHAGPVRQGVETREEVIVLAAPRPAIEAHVGLLSDMGLRLLHIDAEPIALFRVFERFLRRKSDQQSVSVIVDIGCHGTRVVVARGRQIVFIKNVEIGGARLTEAVSKQLGLPLQEADDLRTRTASQETEAPPPDGVEPAAAPSDPAPAPPDLRRTVNWSLRDAIRGEVDLLAKEIALCLRYCSVTFRGLRPDAIILAGGEARDPAVAELLQEHLNLPCRVGQPLRGVDVSGVDLGGDRRSQMAEWALSVGLAARDADMPAGTLEDENGLRDRLLA